MELGSSTSRLCCGVTSAETAKRFLEELNTTWPHVGLGPSEPSPVHTRRLWEVW